MIENKLFKTKEWIYSKEIINRGFLYSEEQHYLVVSFKNKDFDLNDDLYNSKKYKISKLKYITKKNNFVYLENQDYILKIREDKII